MANFVAQIENEGLGLWRCSLPQFAITISYNRRAHQGVSAINLGYIYNDVRIYNVRILDPYISNYPTIICIGENRKPKYHWPQVHTFKLLGSPKLGQNPASLRALALGVLGDNWRLS